ncbi:hypothetical protein NPX13_g231 [Xylaria arbuscula]|uniref:Uncharacterized protein n=1 Tax=Xylaria arbuscula TaxID=114810 RepID=A0A9W8NN80_9PEZI|nr:hypothetical protein NPX13_g231 [Xylaria arbuscula]
MEMECTIAHITLAEFARAFSAVTGKPAQWIDNDLEEHLSTVWGDKADWPAGYNAGVKDPATMTLRENFRAWFNVLRASGGNTGVIKRDYEKMDRVYPGRTRSAEEWLRKENEKGLKKGLGSLWDRIQPENLGYVLKVSEDQRQGRL